MKQKREFFVRCEHNNYTLPRAFKTRADAEQRIERLAMHGPCKQPHTVIEKGGEK